MLTRDVVRECRRSALRRHGESQDGVRQRIAGLPFEREQPAPQYVGLGHLESLGELVETVATLPIEVDLNGGRFGNSSGGGHNHELCWCNHDTES